MIEFVGFDMRSGHSLWSRRQRNEKCNGPRSRRFFRRSGLHRAPQEDREGGTEREIRCPQPVAFISRNKIKEGQADEFRKHYQGSIPPILAGKASALAQFAYENKETDEVTIIRFFADADALDRQIEGAETRSRKTYEFIEPVGIEIFGTLNPGTLEVLKKVVGPGVAVNISPHYLGGFIRQV
jgi:hypothetical protein